MRKWTLYIIVAALILGGGGWLILQRQSANSATSNQTVETAVVQRGDLSVTVEAAGSLTASTEFTLAFPVSGNLYEVTIIIEGQPVKKGDVLARLENNIQAEADYQSLFTDAGIAQSELTVINSREALSYAIDDLVYLIGVDAYSWEKQLAQAEGRLATLNRDTNATVEQKTEAQKEVDEARNWRDYYRELNISKLEKEYKVYDTITKNGNVRHIFLYNVFDTVSDSELLLAYASLEDAKTLLQDAEAALKIVKSGPSALQSPLTALGPEMARLEKTRRNMENTRLTSPIDGVVTALNFQTGEYVTPGKPVAVIGNLTNLEAEVNLDETDIPRIQTGMMVVVSVDAFPGQQMTGQVTEIALSANVQSGVVLYPVTVRLDPTDLPLRSGMTVNVTFPVEERIDTLLVPYRAVETEDGQAYVTRVAASGSERVAVTLGLVTNTQVEILNGLEEGDVVTVYANPIQDTAVMHSPIFGGEQ
jgi:RND family efflux transporter MFP subunit